MAKGIKETGQESQNRDWLLLCSDTVNKIDKPSPLGEPSRERLPLGQPDGEETAEVK